MKKHFIFALFSVFTFLFSAAASEPAIWSINTRAEVLKGESKGVSVAETGTISLAPKLNEVFNAGQPYVWSSAADAAGNVYLGTGSDGKIFRVDANGGGKLFAKLNELNVSALAIGKAGEIYAGTSPDGKVYRIDASGGATVFFEPKEKYVWSLAVFNDGSVAIGTGENGKIYKVKTANAAAESSLFFDTSETHIIALATDKLDNLYAGTDGSGLVLRFSPDGKAFALLDSPLREIHDLAVGADGAIYALALSDSASATKSPTLTTTTNTISSTNSSDNFSVSVDTTSFTPVEPKAKSRYDLAAAKSAVYRILPDGGSDVIWNSPDVTAFSIAANPNGDGVFLGTSDKGRIYSITDDARQTLLLQSNEGQISKMFTRGTQVFAASSNQGKLFRFGAETAAEGVYESSILDAKLTAAWGRIWWRSNGSVALQTRSGNTEKPDETWSVWSANYTDAAGAQIQSPKAKFLQWRAILKNSATLSEVNVAYLSRNIAPEILSIQLLPANVALLANPPVQIDPNIENSGIDPTVFGLVATTNFAPRKIYQRGARALQWTADDRNGDKLEYAVYYREIGETNFKLLKENVRENFLTVDGAAFADGRYIFKIVASDAPSNPATQVLTGEKISEPVEIDNTAPTVAAIGNAQISGNKARVAFEAFDTGSFLNRAEYSVNGGEWLSVYADDGISDSKKERYSFEIPAVNAGEYTVTLRVFDGGGNVGNARILVKK